MLKQNLRLSALMLTVGIGVSTGVGITGCGGSDSPIAPPPPPPGNEVPASAYATNAAYSQYTGSLAAADGTEPLDVDKVVAPTTETEEPADVA